MSGLSYLGQELAKAAKGLGGSIECPDTRVRILEDEADRKFNHKGPLVIEAFLNSVSPSIGPQSHIETARGSFAGLETVVGVHLRLAGG